MPRARSGSGRELCGMNRYGAIARRRGEVHVEGRQRDRQVRRRRVRVMGQAGLAEPRTARFTEWERRTLTRLAADGILSWDGLQDGHGQPAIRAIRRLVRGLEDGGGVAWGPQRVALWLAAPGAPAPPLRGGAQRRLPAAHRAGE